MHRRRSRQRDTTGEMRTYEGPFVGSHFKWQISHLRDINLTRSAAARCSPEGWIAQLPAATASREPGCTP